MRDICNIVSSDEEKTCFAKFSNTYKGYRP
jgi:hypothetical protein